MLFFNNIHLLSTLMREFLYNSYIIPFYLRDNIYNYALSSLSDLMAYQKNTDVMFIF